MRIWVGSVRIIGTGPDQTQLGRYSVPAMDRWRLINALLAPAWVTCMMKLTALSKSLDFFVKHVLPSVFLLGDTLRAPCTKSNAHGAAASMPGADNPHVNSNM